MSTWDVKSDYDKRNTEAEIRDFVKLLDATM